MTSLSDSFPSPNNSMEIVNGTIDEFIDNLQLTWAINAAEGVVELKPGSLLCREIELALLRVIDQTVSPENIYIRIGNELKHFDRPADRAANPLFHSILLCCYQLMQGWADERWFEYLPTIEQSLRDALHMDARRRAGVVGISAPRDLELYRSLENAMYADHRLRMRVDTQVNILEGVIAKMKAAESSHGHDNKFEMENREE
ncbi:hypothetical protein BCIN_02g01100 [Botrytis cinerea B05.10]|uniref:Uncharacterized protein n=2 Tax=Botryotinia fuckeliana TaxID=40559 RepID=A0A384J872_BOTFB|nr:hypothetical protein BCIN_02g01100 [Botrytis cinerea B05.10]ATZ46739.1 hypothetical protein BCIN_02g01100 [Botrytis cinerea B05.10]EMR84827.1 hypothetical protein BcDW1_6441 [Botrytis cinerea BcDW1]